MKKMTINPDLNQSSCRELATLLRTEFIFYAMTCNADKNFNEEELQLHQSFFKRHSGEIEEIIDYLTDQLQSLAVIPSEGIDGFLKLSCLRATLGEQANCKQYISLLLGNHEERINELRERNEIMNPQTEGVGDVVVHIMAQHERMASMLRSQLQSVC